jgi:hypothetical protein
LNTSYFSKSGDLPTAVSIAGKTPESFTGRRYRQLAPRYWFFHKYKLDGDADFYTQQYQAEVLDKLDPKEVLRDLGEDAVRYEKPGQFCHRHLVSAWFREHGINVTEL